MAEQYSRQEWEARASQLTIRAQAFIDGRYRDAASGRTFASHSPVDGRKLADVAECGQADVDLAVASARRAFTAGHWAETRPAQRKKVLFAFADLIETHALELALLETLDMGKPISDSLRVDISGAARCVRWHAEAIDKVYGEIAATGPNELGLITRHALGVVAAIVPWNFPLLMASWKFAPALAAGNSVILKPSEKSPLTAIRVAELAAEAGIPDGVFNVLPGFGPGAGQALGLHGDVDGLVFTGSTAVGKQLFILSGQSNLKRVYTECGGKSPNIVFADCPDIDAAARAAASAIFFNQGEVCTAASRLLVEKPIQAEFMEKVMAASQSRFPGHPLEPATTMGAIVDQLQLDKVLGYIDTARQEGAALRLGGKRTMQDTGGLYLEPTIFAGVTPDMTIFKEEIFGPVLSCVSFEGEQQALQIANDSVYGLAAAVWSRDIGKAHRVARQLRAGSVWVNNWDGGDMTMPFGGFKQSGNGRDKSLHALDKYTELKSTWIKLDV